MNDNNFSKLSYELTKNITKENKKKDGIYFTPPKTINRNLDILEPYMKNIKTILEPSCGSCEYLLKLSNKYKDLKLTGIEFNETIFNSIKSLQDNNLSLLNENFLTYKQVNNPDLIIGNPPYYVMKKSDVNKIYYNYFDGRPNIFILFIIKSLSILSLYGILSFVLPKNFLNCLYYNKTRELIYQNYKILHISKCNDDYIETKQDTVLFIVQKVKDVEFDNIKYVLQRGKYTIFGEPEHIEKLKILYYNSTTLNNLNFIVNVGSIPWNQYKKDLTDDKTKTLLIYSSDIKDNKIVIQKYSNKDKKNYINKDGTKGPLLIINRGYGVGKYNFNYCLLDIESEYLIENHLIFIKYTKTISDEDLKILYKNIIKSFENKKTAEFIKLYFGNNAINTTELSDILPIYEVE